MRISTTCHACIFLNPDNPIYINTSISIQEDDLYFYKCPLGHNNLLEIQAFKFELLFESGLCAIRDNYYLESVLSLTAALERFYEFFIKLILKSNDINNELINEIYNIMAKQSERQLGSYVSLFSNHYNHLPLLLKNSSIEFRNKVVHKGFLPNEKNVLKYAEEVYEVIKAGYILVQRDFDDHIMDNLFSLQLERRTKFKDLIKDAKCSISMLGPNFAITHVLPIEDFRKRTFEMSFNTVKNSIIY